MPTCKACHEDKPDAAFGPKGTRLGRELRCRACISAVDRARYRAAHRPGHVRAAVDLAAVRAQIRARLGGVDTSTCYVPAVHGHPAKRCPLWSACKARPIYETVLCEAPDVLQPDEDYQGEYSHE